VNGFCLKAGGQRGLRVTESRRKGENYKGETMPDHRFLRKRMFKF
jgi:hypothetical protein